MIGPRQNVNASGNVMWHAIVVVSVKNCCCGQGAGTEETKRSQHHMNSRVLAHGQVSPILELDISRLGCVLDQGGIRRNLCGSTVHKKGSIRCQGRINSRLFQGRNRICSRYPTTAAVFSSLQGQTKEQIMYTSNHANTKIQTITYIRIIITVTLAVTQRG